MTIFLQYATLGGVVSALGIGLSIPAMLVARVVPESFVVAFMACVIAFLILDNWSLAKDLQVKSQPLDEFVATQKQHIRIIGEVSIQNSILMSSNDRMTRDMQRLGEVSLESMHWRLLAHKALALNQIERIQVDRHITRSTSCD
jgi:hypothetical protein